MPVIRIREGASHRLDDIYRYSWDRWGDEKAETYITGLFAAHCVISKPILAEFGLNGCFFRDECHFVYWRLLSNVDIVTIPREHMHQIDRFRDDFGLV